MIHLAGPYVVAALLVGTGLYGALARRNAVLVLIGVEIMLAGAGVLLVATSAAGRAGEYGSVLTLFVITIAAAEIVLALALVLAVFARRGDIDLTRDTHVPAASGDAADTATSTDRGGRS
ncbi:NADH-quinone oxidoreductase subunit NuoK [Janibacter sp. G1551]|uniref:NADH-quinone oxidoreductase subunit NuoK n=1 Tax=Janibacter sp. G1551 TaxID=3420440 RepID=UPI003D03DEAA